MSGGGEAERGVDGGEAGDAACAGGREEGVSEGDAVGSCLRHEQQQSTESNQQEERHHHQQRRTHVYFFQESAHFEDNEFSGLKEGETKVVISVIVNGDEKYKTTVVVKVINDVKYTVTLDLDGGSCEKTSYEVKKGERLLLPLDRKSVV